MLIAMLVKMSMLTATAMTPWPTVDCLLDKADAREEAQASEHFNSAVKGYVEGDRRRHAQWGRVFGPDVAEWFRHRVASALKDVECDFQALRDEEEEAGLPPATEVGRATWPSIVWRLPRLPEALEYRFVGRHLWLVDTRTGVVVDILPDAWPYDAVASPPATPQGEPCDADPELTTCWT